MRTELATLHGGECDLLVLGESLFAAAVAWHAAGAGMRVVLAAARDLPSQSACRGRTWLEAAPACRGDVPRAFAMALGEREALLRAAAPFVRPAAVVAAMPSPAAARALARELGRARASTLPPPRASGSAVAAFDGVCDDVGLARAVAAAAAARGARIVAHAQVAAAGAQGITLRQRLGAAEARVRARHVLLAMDEGADAAASALRAGLAAPWAAAAEARSPAAHEGGGPITAAPSAAGLGLAVPLERHRLLRWLPRQRGPGADASAPDWPATSPWREVRWAVPTREASATTAAAQLHEWPWQASAPFHAAAAFVAQRFDASPLDLRTLGGGPSEPTDRLWRRYGARATVARRRCGADAEAGLPLCPHRPTLAGEVAFAVHDDGALGFADVLRRLDADGAPCLSPECVAAAHAAFMRCRAAPVDDDPADAIAAFVAAP